jgi:hypothetical protein
LPSAVLFVFKLQHSRSHPLFNDVGFFLGPKKQFQWQIEFPCYNQLLFTILGIDSCFSRHAISFLIYIFS